MILAQSFSTGASLWSFFWSQIFQLILGRAVLVQDASRLARAACISHPAAMDWSVSWRRCAGCTWVLVRWGRPRLLSLCAVLSLDDDSSISPTSSDVPHAGVCPSMMLPPLLLCPPCPQQVIVWLASPHPSSWGGTRTLWEAFLSWRVRLLPTVTFRDLTCAGICSWPTFLWTLHVSAYNTASYSFRAWYCLRFDI